MAPWGLRHTLGSAPPAAAAVTAVALCGKGRWAAVGAADGAVVLWDAVSGAPLALPLPWEVRRLR